MSFVNPHHQLGQEYSRYKLAMEDLLNVFLGWTGDSSEIGARRIWHKIAC